MAQFPRTDKELQLAPRFCGVRRMHMDDAARIGSAPMCNAAVSRKRRDQIVEQARLADADRESHRTNYPTEPFRGIQTSV
jgi:hypothetical protein